MRIAEVESQLFGGGHFVRIITDTASVCICSWAAISPKSKPGYQSTTTYLHQSTLRLILKGLGVNTFPGAAATAPDMSEFFNP